MNGFMRALLILITLAAAAIGAPKTEAQSSRFLFVVDVSSSMRKLDTGNRQALFDLIYNGVDNHMAAGDTFGLWTFNPKLAAGEFPMHRWHPTNTLQAASRAATFLKKKHYSGDCDFTPLFFSVNALMKAVKDVNVVILTDGETPVKGTSKDQEINAVFRARAVERKKAEKPFIISLAIRGGAITNCFVTLPGEPIPLPPPPPKLAVKRPAPEITNAPPVVAKPVITRPPLILKGTQKAEVSAVTAPAETPASVASKEQPAPATPNPEPAAGKTAKGPDDATSSTPVTAPKPDESLTSFAPAVLLNSDQSSSTALALIDDDTAAASDENQVSMASTPAPTAAISGKESALHPEPVSPSPKESFPLNAQPLGSGANSADNSIPTTLGLNPQWLMVAGCMLLLGVFAVLLMIYRRMHRLPSPSIITRSMERE